MRPGCSILARVRTPSEIEKLHAKIGQLSVERAVQRRPPRWPGLAPGERSAIVRTLIARVITHPTKLDIEIVPEALRHLLQAAPKPLPPAELERIGHTLRPLEIVLVNTRAGAGYGQAEYVDSGCGMGREATLHLLRQGIRVVGTDGWSWDAGAPAPRSA